MESSWVKGAGSTPAAVVGPLEPNADMRNSWRWWGMAGRGNFHTEILLLEATKQVLPVLRAPA